MSSNIFMVPFEAEHGLELARNVREPEVATWLQRPIQPQGPAWTGFWKGQVIGAAGFTEVYGPGSSRAIAWALFAPMPLAAVRAVYRIMRAKLAEAPYQRIEANVNCLFGEGHRFARAMGFRLETNCKPAWTPEGHAVSEYVIVKVKT